MTSRTDRSNESSWSGYLTVENFRAVAERVRWMLTGKRYTMVEMIHRYTSGGQLPPTLKVHTGLRIYGNWTEDTPGDPNDPIHLTDEDDGTVGFHVVGSQGWFVHTRKTDQTYEDMDAPELDSAATRTWPVYVKFEGQIEIRIVDRAPSGNRVETVIAIENRDSSPHCPACGRDLWDLQVHECPVGTPEPLHIATLGAELARREGAEAREAVLREHLALARKATAS